MPRCFSMLLSTLTQKQFFTRLTPDFKCTKQLFLHSKITKDIKTTQLRLFCQKKTVPPEETFFSTHQNRIYKIFSHFTAYSVLTLIVIEHFVGLR